MKKTTAPSPTEQHSGSEIRAGASLGSTFTQTVRLLIRNSLSHNVAQNGAALAYYLLFALFPLLIFISNLLGLLELDVASITRSLTAFLPRDVVDIIASYLDHVSHSSSGLLLSFSLVFTVYFPMRATGGLMDNVRCAYSLQKPKHPAAYTLRKLIYTAVLFIVLALILFLSTAGQQVLDYIIEMNPGASQIRMPDILISLWHYLRFLPMGLIMFAALSVLYALAQDQRQPASAILPGAITALVAWLAVSVGFSFYVENFANYSIIYGTLGTVIVLLLWLYMTAVILILGAELNAALLAVRQDKLKAETALV